MARKRKVSAAHLMSELADQKFVPTLFEPSIAEPDQSLTIEEIMKNVVATGTTGLPSGPEAVYDDDDNNDFDDPTLDPGLTVMEAMDIMQDTKNKYRHSIKDVKEANWRRQQILNHTRRVNNLENPASQSIGTRGPSDQ